MFCSLVYATDDKQPGEKTNSERKETGRKDAAPTAEKGSKEQAERKDKEPVKGKEGAETKEAKPRVKGEPEGRPDFDKAVHRLKERFQELHAAEKKLREDKGSEKELAHVREQIQNTEREMKQLHASFAKGHESRPELKAHADKLGAAMQRLQHMKAAVENLKRAEMHDVANDIAKHAERMEQELQQAKQRLTAEASAHAGQPQPDVIRDLKQEIERLRAQVQELSGKIEKR